MHQLYKLKCQHTKTRFLVQELYKIKVHDTLEHKLMNQVRKLICQITKIV
jgi:hypothetical protein